MERKIGFGIVGLGSVARTHAYALGKSEYCFLRAVYSPDREKCRKYEEEYGCLSYSDFSSFLKDDGVDVVLVATPSGLHEKIAVPALMAGKHVLIEKPIEINEEKAARIIEEGRRQHRLVGGIFQNRFYDGAMLIKKALDEERFGRVVMVEASFKWYRSQEYYDSGAWRGTWDIDGGGVLMNQGIHAVDLLSWFGGDTESVTGLIATLSHERIEVEDNVAAVLRFRSGALGIINGSTSIYPGFSRRIEVCGTEGSAILEDEALTVWSFRNEREADRAIREKYAKVVHSGSSTSATDINWLGHMRQFDDFALSILEGRKPLVTGEDALKSVKLIRAIYSASESGKCVKL